MDISNFIKEFKYKSAKKKKKIKSLSTFDLKTVFKKQKAIYQTKWKKSNKLELEFKKFLYDGSISMPPPPFKDHS